MPFTIVFKKIKSHGVVQQLRFHASTAVDRASIPWSKAKFPWAVWCGQGEKKKKALCGGGL